MKNKELRIVAGPCSVDESNLDQIYEISEIKVDKKRAVWGTRVVGLKSRTALNKSGDGMGMDYDILMKNNDKLLAGASADSFEIAPSMKLAEKIVRETDLLVATEVMMPHIQMPLLERVISANKLLAWSPSVNQLGWPLMQTSQYAARNDWWLGIKNGKWIGIPVSDASEKNSDIMSPVERCWEGLSKYAQNDKEKTVLIHRGFLAADRRDYRAMPIHELAARVKKRSGLKLFFDPSHSYGPNLRDKIVDDVVKLLSRKFDDGEFLYDGILIEVGDSITDTDQHISVDELRGLIEKLSEIRTLVGLEG
ncbi:hypothetical protein GF357_04855 [Candidatus Dojkabacteria bacterium]|nr:hypothetical protein [Candidatus Dojkabacteria bacterium]